jgi:hypothetical protein
LEAEGSGIILSEEQWQDIKSIGKKQFIIETICIDILLIITLSLVINIIVVILYKIKPNLSLILLVFVVQPIFLALIYSITQIYIIYKFNLLIYKSKNKDRRYYKRYYTISNISSTFAGVILLFSNIHSLMNFNMLNLFELLVGGILLSVLRGIFETKRKFNGVYEEAIEKIDQRGNK